MAKAEPLTFDTLKVPQVTPQAATPARAPAPVRGQGGAAPPAADPKEDQVPLQVRIPRKDARAIRLAAIERDQTISGFMLACFHAYMNSSGRKQN